MIRSAAYLEKLNANRAAKEWPAMIAHDITTLDDLQAETLDLAQAYMAVASSTVDPRSKRRLYDCAAALASVAYVTGKQSNVLLSGNVS
jgi:hypothetical protein